MDEQTLVPAVCIRQVSAGVAGIELSQKRKDPRTPSALNGGHHAKFATSRLALIARR